MIRKFIALKDIEIYDDFHYQSGNSFEVNVEKDGNTTEYHKEGIKSIKGVLKKGAKILPILVYEQDEGYFILLDGFKRCMAHLELSKRLIEAFVVDFIEYNGRVFIDYNGKKMRAWKGGQPYEEWGLFEGEEHEDSAEYQTQKFLYKDDNKPHGLRIEMSECIHVHWGEYGRYRLAVSEREFKELAEAVSKIE